MTNFLKKMSFTETLSLKVSADFLAMVRMEAAERGLSVSDFIRERLGVAALTKVAHSSDRTPLGSVSVGKAKSRPFRPQHLGMPNGSDPVIVCMLASVANGLREVASALGSDDSLAPVASADRWLAVMLEIEGRLSTLISHEDRKNAH